MMRLGNFLLINTIVLVIGTQTVSAQGYTGDARRIGMGGVGDWSNTAWELVQDEADYRSIPIPLGLFQALENLDIYNPDSDEFNPALAISYATSPLHHSFDRGGSAAGQDFLLDIVNAEISRDLNAYRGFTPRSEFSAGGVISPDWGKTFWIVDNGIDASHGFYVGAGPYLSFDTDLDFDENLINVFSSPSMPNASYTILDRLGAQGAAALTLGYRARLPVAGSLLSDRDGVYIAVNYNYLYGIYFEDIDINVQFDTDDAGLMTLFPTTEPVVIDRLASADGSGFSLDLATAVIVDRWEFTASADGIGNQIDWSNLRANQYVVSSVLDGSDFVETSLPSPSGVLRVELPVRYSGGAAYTADKWSASANVAHGFQDFEFHGGVEYSLGPIDVRGGTRYSYDLWHPAWGAGFNLTEGFGVDLAFFGQSTNIEKVRELGMALSLRLTSQR